MGCLSRICRRRRLAGLRAGICGYQPRRLGSRHDWRRSCARAQPRHAIDGARQRGRGNGDRVEAVRFPDPGHRERDRGLIPHIRRPARRGSRALCPRKSACAGGSQGRDLPLPGFLLAHRPLFALPLRRAGDRLSALSLPRDPDSTQARLRDYEEVHGTSHLGQRDPARIRYDPQSGRAAGALPPALGRADEPRAGQGDVQPAGAVPVGHGRLRAGTG